MELVLKTSVHRNYQMTYHLMIAMMKLDLVEDVRTLKYHVFTSPEQSTVMCELWVRANERAKCTP